MNKVLDEAFNMPPTRTEMFGYLEELQANIVDVMEAFNTMKSALNNQAEVLGLLRFTIQKYLPATHLEEAAGEYKRIREAQIVSAARQEDILLPPASGGVN